MLFQIGIKALQSRIQEILDLNGALEKNMEYTEGIVFNKGFVNMNFLILCVCKIIFSVETNLFT